MKKEIFSICLLLAMLTAALINIHCLNGLTNDIIKHIADSIDAVNANDWEKAENCANEAEKLWVQKRGYTHIVLRHGEIDTVSDAMYDYITSIYTRDKKACLPVAGKVKYHLDSIYQMEQVRFGSIF